MILLYDGSIRGFLCLLGVAIKERLEVTEIIRGKQRPTADLFNCERQIDTDITWAATVAKGLETKLGKRFLTTVGQALFSELEGIELDLLLLCRHALRQGRDILNHLADPLVNRINEAALRTARERHRLLGLLRFSRLNDGSYLARIIPRSNVVPLLGSHFTKRLGDQRWLIIDDKRKVGVLGDKRRWQILNQVEISPDLSLHAGEQMISDLWRGFYKNISNPDRYNPKLRQKFMPQQYWQYLPELQSEHPSPGKLHPR